jgi:hypothetical protein
MPWEKIKSERALLLHIQKAGFRSTLFQLKTHGRVNHDNALAPLAPFVNPQGLVRLSGRTEAAELLYEAKYPLILHAKDPVVEVMARHIHDSLMHSGGPRAIHTELSKFYWVPKVTTLLRKVAYKCMICRRKFAKPTAQMMVPLSFFRLPTSKLHPFNYSAIDVAGPFVITITKCKITTTYKRWLLVIRCVTVGAVHLEMLNSMTEVSFLMAMERFLALRPRPSVILADNRTNFRGGDNKLNDKNQIDISEAQQKLNIKFCFAPPRAPYFMGLVERMVGGAKAALRPALRTRAVTGEEIRTVFSKTMGILNNFPIS